MAVHTDAPLGTEIRFDDLDHHRRALTGYCYRMLGSSFEADGAVQETMVRAWRAIDGFEGRSALRSWLFRIATNVCLDMLRGRQRRALAMDLGPSSTADSFTGSSRGPDAWVQPIPDGRVLADDGDPADLVASRESIRLAFVTALQHLPARQRAVLILREVLRGRPPRRPSCSTPPWPRSTAPSSERVPHWRLSTSPRLRYTSATPTSTPCWPATSTPSSATTSPHW
ncbi:MAG TPA: sigma-70 family RNA polymerase sigma factor [Acidimicrobiales bacterium]|nr:sigma-70 family RNA polymerase sigma factor [Acidimicrobiales bacterium]